MSIVRSIQESTFNASYHIISRTYICDAIVEYFRFSKVFFTALWNQKNGSSIVHQKAESWLFYGIAVKNHFFQEYL